jgi:hypothetical protein
MAQQTPRVNPFDVLSLSSEKRPAPTAGSLYFSGSFPMHIYDDEVFRMACEQFGVIADYLNIDKNDRDRLMFPKRSMAVTLPVHMDDGSTQTFQGYRVQHHLTLGPTKGGTRFAPNLSMGETAALAMWMSWKCALNHLPYGAPLHAGDDPVRRTEDRHHGTRHGNQ